MFAPHQCGIHIRYERLPIKVQNPDITATRDTVVLSRYLASGIRMRTFSATNARHKNIALGIKPTKSIYMIYTVMML